MSLTPNVRRTLLAFAAALTPAASLLPVPPPAHAAARVCVGEQGDSARAAGDPGGEEEDEGAAPTFGAAFHRLTFTLDVSLDGAQGDELPISIEEICEIPKAHAKEAGGLAGTEGIALVRPGTTVWSNDTRLRGTDAATALEGADTATLRVRLARPRWWHEDEDGDPVPTFVVSRVEITD